MPDHARELWDLLGKVGARPEGLELHQRGPDRPQWYFHDLLLHNVAARALIEHAAIVWLMGRDMHPMIEDDGLFNIRRRANGVSFAVFDEPFNTLADALLAAVERETKGVGDG